MTKNEPKHPNTAPKPPIAPAEVVRLVKKKNVLDLGRGPRTNTHSGALEWAYWCGFCAAEAVVHQKAAGPETSGSTKTAKAIIKHNAAMVEGWEATPAPAPKPEKG